MTRQQALKGMDSAIATCTDPVALETLKRHRADMVQHFRAQDRAMASNWKKTQDVARRFWAKADFSVR